MKISIITFDDFTDLDLYFMWDLLKRVEHPDWKVQILSDHCCPVSSTGVKAQTHGRLEEADTSDVVLFTSGPGTRRKIYDEPFLAAFNLDSSRQMIGSMCSGALILAALGLLEGKRATTYPTSRKLLQSMGVKVVEEPFVREGNVATAAGCLAAQYLVGWVIDELIGVDERKRVMKSIQPVGEGLSFSDLPAEEVPAGASVGR
ncbi:MAG: DJ-1/PfpI family protein [Acidobacteriota bacterium]|nr:DJ-1/PfpI family protein [Acidobacteriota bacterium]